MGKKSIAALLVNVNSIQGYIFTSNKLKENIGASYIIEDSIQEYLKKSLEKVLGEPVDIDAWKQENGSLPEDYPIGFIGGGNSLLFFPGSDIAKLFVRDFSTAILEGFPGLKLSFGLKEDFDLSDYLGQYNLLIQDQKQRKSSTIPVVNIPKQGITADCPVSNDAAEIFNDSLGKYISRSSSVKFLTQSSVTTKWDKFLNIRGFGKDYTLKTEIEGTLGQKEKGSYIAVVHVDGNGMGDVFSKIGNINELRKKSAAVSGIAVEAMEKTISLLINDHKSGRLTELNLVKEPGKNGRLILPIRPVLVGGDDITFICEGRLGIYLAEKFINEFYSENQRTNKDESRKIMEGACAGVAIVKTHFPFYKAVKLAEELCQEAKKCAKSTATGGSFISYYYSATTFAGSLEQLREKTQLSVSGSMYYGPYQLFNPLQARSIEKLKNGISVFKNCNKGQNWPKNKVMLLRDIIAGEKAAQQLFEKEMEGDNLKFPENGKTVWFDNGTTPYFDQIELMDFYPEQLLK